MTEPVEFDLDSRLLVRRVMITCVSCEALLVFLDYRVNYRNLIDIGAIRRFFNMAREDGLGSFFAITQTVLIALTLWLIFAVVKKHAGPRWRPAGWMALAIFFTYLAVDDGAMLHERMGTAFERTLEGRGSIGELVESFPSYAWQLLYMPLFSLVGVLLTWFMWRELRDKRSRVIVVIALACLSFAVVLDFVEGLDEDHPLNWYTYIADTFDWEAHTQRAFGESTFDTLAHFSRSIEEFTEMLANTLLWSVFLLHFMRLAPDLRVRFRSTEPTRRPDHLLH